MANLTHLNLSESNTMNNLPLTINGIPNYKNDLVLAALIDTVGINLTKSLNELVPANAHDPVVLTEEWIRNLVNVQILLQQLRHSIPVNSTVPETHELVSVILDEMAAHRRKSKAMLQNDVEKIRAIAKELGIEDYAEQFLREQGIAPSVSDAADEILRDLRETGTIGGSRAV